MKVNEDRRVAQSYIKFLYKEDDGIQTSVNVFAALVFAIVVILLDSAVLAVAFLVADIWFYQTDLDDDDDTEAAERMAVTECSLPMTARDLAAARYLRKLKLALLSTGMNAVFYAILGAFVALARYAFGYAVTTDFRTIFACAIPFIIAALGFGVGGIGAVRKCSTLFRTGALKLFVGGVELVGMSFCYLAAYHMMFYTAPGTIFGGLFSDLLYTSGMDFGPVLAMLLLSLFILAVGLLIYYYRYRKSVDPRA